MRMNVEDSIKPEQDGGHYLKTGVRPIGINWPTSDEKPNVCAGCNLLIVDRFLLKVRDAHFHEHCMRCSACNVQLLDSCYSKENSLFCKDDYHRLYGCKCSGCGQGIAPDELVMRAVQNVYHTDCFKCDECGDRLEKGDEYILRDGKLFCSADFNLEEQKSDIEIFSSDENESLGATSPQDLDKNMASSCKRPRTILTAQQRQDFKAAFEVTPKPCRKVREQLSKETGLSVRVVQVWFQNQRAKLKKMQRKTEDGSSSVETVKRTNNSGKVTKKKKTSKGSTLQKGVEIANDIPAEFSLPVTQTNSPYESMMNMSANISSYYGGSQPQVLTDSHPRHLPFPGHLPLLNRPHFAGNYPPVLQNMNGNVTVHQTFGSPVAYPVPQPVQSMRQPIHNPQGEQLSIMHHLMNTF